MFEFHNGESRPNDANESSEALDGAKANDSND